MIKEYKNYIIVIIGILLILTMFIGVNYLMNSYEEIPEIKSKEEKDNNTFAIMVQNGDTYEEYTSEDNTWPGDDYVYKEAKCTDNNGALVEGVVTFADGKATLITDQTIYCTLYFDEKPNPIKYLRSKDPSGILSPDLQGGMYRYQAAPANAEEAAKIPNWICFGTKDVDACKTGIDKYMYRIIGITEEGQMYLLKETFIKEGSGASFTWNDKILTSGSGTTTCSNKICPEWNTSLLFKRINGISNGTTKGTGTTSNKANTDIFVDNSEYEYMVEGNEWYNLIEEHDWMYGDTIAGLSDESTYIGDTMYAIETGQADTKHYVGTNASNKEQTYKWNQSVKAKISLMYIHDYLYSYYDGSDTTTRGNPKINSTAKTSWIYFQKDGYNTSPTHEWLSVRWGISSTTNANVGARFVSSGGTVGYGYLSDVYGARPVFYLEPSVKIASGEGTKDSPFILE